MHILLTRPIEDCSEMIIRFQSLGHKVSHLPLLSIKKILYEKIDLSEFRAIIFTSSNAVRFLNFNGLNKNLLKSKIAMSGKIGFVGNPIKLEKKNLINAINKGKVPIISPIGFDEKGNKYNINADIAAGFIAETLKVKRLLLLTDVEGVLDNNKKLIVELNKKKAFEYIKKGIIKGGMIPKVKTCFKTLNKGVKGVALVDGRKADAILMELLTAKGAGTLIKK